MTRENKTDFILEKATSKDATIIIELLSKLYIELGEEAGSIAFLTPTLINTLLETGNTEIYFVKSNGLVCGIVSLTESQAVYAGGKFGALDEMYIAPGYRDRGFGAMCIEHIKLIAEKKGWKRIDVTAPTEEKWVRTVAFYKANGFTFTGPKFKLNF